MSTHTCKFFEECLRDKLQRYVERHCSGLFANQFGFQKGISIFSAHRRYKDDIEEMGIKLAEDGNVNNPVSLFIDYKDAYGSVRIDKLIEILRRDDIWDAEEINVFRFLHGNCKFRLGNSLAFTKRGLMQGSKISCELFIIYLANCMKEVREKEAQQRISTKFSARVEYVDDVVNVAALDTVETIYTILKNVSFMYGLVINVRPDGKKTALLLDKKMRNGEDEEEY